MVDTLPAERRALERPDETTPRNSNTDDDYCAYNVAPPEVFLHSELALGVVRELELSKKPICLRSDLALRCLIEDMPTIKLVSPLARRAALAVEREEQEDSTHKGFFLPPVAKEARPFAARSLAL